MARQAACDPTAVPAPWTAWPRRPRWSTRFCFFSAKRLNTNSSVICDGEYVSTPTDANAVVVLDARKKVRQHHVLRAGRSGGGMVVAWLAAVGAVG